MISSHSLISSVTVFVAMVLLLRPPHVASQGHHLVLDHPELITDEPPSTLTPAPLPTWFKFQSNDTVNGWIDALDNKSITEHAYELWAALTTLTDQEYNKTKVPVYFTWWDARVALAPPTTPKRVLEGMQRSLQLETPRQFKRMKQLEAQETNALETCLFDQVKYNDKIMTQIRDRKYNDGKQLKMINDGWGNSKPIADRKLVDFDNDSVMLKPVYRVLSASSISLLRYWAGPNASSNPAVPDESTWTKKLVVIPPELGVDPKILSLKDLDGSILPAVPLSNFFHIKLNKDDLATLPKSRCAGAKEGDYLVLLAMHVSSREIDNWTWQTFWWSLAKPSIPPSIKDKLKPPFDQYQAAVGYSFLTAPSNPNSLTLTCFNPYLEAGFADGDFVYTPKQRGIESNCMSCHRTAAWPGPDQRYAGNGAIDPADAQIFAGRTKTDFLWGIADRVAAPTLKTQAGKQYTVYMLDDNSFDPVTLTINAGDSVTWDNSGGGRIHDAKSDDDGATFNTGDIEVGGKSSTVVFPKARTYPYRCTHHSTMKGTITVRSGNE